MQYNRLSENIISILYSSDFELTMSFYNKDGNLVLPDEEVQWIYIDNLPMIIELPTEFTPSITVWKDSSTLSKGLKNIFMRIRQQCLLNGVSLNIKLFNNLDKRQIYNIIKTTINKNEKQEVEESFEPLCQAFTNLHTIAIHTKKNSDLFLSEALQVKNRQTITNEMINEINALLNVKKSNALKGLIESLDINELREKLSDISLKNKQLYNKLIENKESIDNIGKFVKNKYISNNITNTSYPKTILVLENVKVYEAVPTINEDYKTKIYNHLSSVCASTKTPYEALKAIKNNQLSETYSIDTTELLDIWLNKDIVKSKPKHIFIIESIDGNKVSAPLDSVLSINTLAKFINNGGKVESRIGQYIINEGIKLKEVTEFLKEYGNNINVTPLVKKFKPIIETTLDKLHKLEENFDESFIPTIPDYSTQYVKLVEQTGIKHPALKYLAMSEARVEKKVNRLLSEERLSDICEINYNLLNFVPKQKGMKVAESIVDNGLIVKQPLKETYVTKDNARRVSKALYENIVSVDNDSIEPLKTYLYANIYLNSPINEEQVDFLNTIIRHIKQ